MLIQEVIAQEQGELKKSIEKLFATFPKLMHVGLSECKEGDTLIEEGSPCDVVYLLLSGSVLVSWDNPGISQYTAKQQDPLTFIGDMDIIAGNSNFSANINIAKKSRFIIISKKAFERWMELDLELYRSLVQKNILLLQEQAELSRLTAREPIIYRIMEFFYKEYQTSGKTEEEKVRIDRKREEIADDIWIISIRTLNRYIKKLKEEDFISIEKGKITVSKEQAQRIERYLEHSVPF